MPDQICEVDEKGAKVNYCPCGCAVEDLDEFGYCTHLVGFSNDCRSVEPMMRVMRKRKTEDGQEVDYDTGIRRVLSTGARRITDDECVINPDVRQVDNNGITSIKKKWVSSRVYKKPGNIEGMELVRPQGPAPDSPIAKKLDELTDMVLNLARSIQAQSQRIEDIENSRTEPAKPELVEA